MPVLFVLSQDQVFKACAAADGIRVDGAFAFFGFCLIAYLALTTGILWNKTTMITNVSSTIDGDGSAEVSF